MPEKKIVNILFSNDERYGGTVVASIELAKSCQRRIKQVFIIGPTSKEVKYVDKSVIEFHKTPWKNFFSFSFMPRLPSKLNKLKDETGIIHINGVWNLYNLQALNWVKKNKIPVVWTVHGELDPYRIKLKWLKKKLFLFFFLQIYKKNVSLVRAITQKERQIIKDMGFKQPVKIIPNGISCVNMSSKLTTKSCRDELRINRDRKVLLYASRVSPEKGIDILVTAFDEISKEIPGWQLIIAGSEVGASPRWLKRLKNKIRLSNKIEYIGHWPANKKEVLFRAADCFVLPSFSDVISLSVLEASSFAIPSIITEGCDFPELINAGGAFLISHNNMQEELKDILKNPLDVFERMGVLAQNLVKTEYTWDKIRETMVHEYQNLLGVV